MSRIRQTVCLRGDGIILLEVVVALVLLSLLVVPLVAGFQAAAGRARTVQSGTGRISAPSGPSGSEEAWEWGPMVASASWAPGPVLHLRVERQADTDLLVGFWVDGWFLGEEKPDGEGEVTLKAAVWSGSAGRELVARVRACEKAWGPPWRSVVPVADGRSSPLSPAEEGIAAAGEVAAGEGAAGEAESVAHEPALANPLFKVSWTSVGLGAGPTGPPVALPPLGSGQAELDLDDDAQSWLVETGRALDLYF
jgi:hypothetical protein